MCTSLFNHEFQPTKQHTRDSSYESLSLSFFLSILRWYRSVAGKTLNKTQVNQKRRKQVMRSTCVHRMRVRSPENNRLNVEVLPWLIHIMYVYVYGTIYRFN